MTIIVISITTYSNRKIIWLKWNQLLYTSPLEWNDVILHFDKSNIIEKGDGWIRIYSLIRPKGGAISVYDSSQFKVDEILYRDEKLNLIAPLQVSHTKFKGINCMILKTIHYKYDFIGVHMIIPEIRNSISYAGPKEDYEFFKKIIDAIEINKNQQAE